MDDALIGKGINAGLSYAIRGRRFYGSDVAPPIAHIGHKMAQVGRYGQLAYAGYRLGKKFYNSLKRPRSASDSFLQNEKKMPRRNSTPTPRSRRNSNAMSIVSGTPRSTPRRRLFAAGPSFRRKLMMRGLMSPGFWKKSGKRKSLSRSGAASSRSAGKFKKARGGKQILDTYMKYGIVQADEDGAVLGTTAVEKAQSIVLGHCTFGQLKARQQICLALTKLISIRLDRTFYNLDELIIGMTGGAQRQQQLTLTYSSQASPTGNAFTILFGITDTWGNCYNALLTQISAFDNDTLFKMLFMQWDYIAVGTTPEVARENVFKIDLTRCRVKFYVKSNLKIQNRTINSSGNDEEGDVDNVPIYGKQYDGTGNYVFYNHTLSALNTTQYLVGNSDNLISTKGIAATVTDCLREPPPISVLKKTKKIGKAKLEPGEIKTSTMTYQSSFLLNELLQKLVISSLTADTETSTFGTFRLFIFEKMLQAVATDGVNGLKVAYELDAKYGCIATAPKVTVTTALITALPS